MNLLFVYLQADRKSTRLTGVHTTLFRSLVSVFSSWFSVLNRLLVVLALSICCL